jgi:hypothetical protein
MFDEITANARICVNLSLITPYDRSESEYVATDILINSTLEEEVSSASRRGRLFLRNGSPLHMYKEVGQAKEAVWRFLECRILSHFRE